MRIYIMRHGETDWNKAFKLQGQTNTELNENGRRLARLTADGLKDISFDYAFSSPLNRAYETAGIVLKGSSVKIVKDVRLSEVAFGEYEGTVGYNRAPDSPIKKFFDKPEEYVADKGAESFESLFKRAGEFLEEVIFPLSKEAPDANVLISGHGALNKALMAKLLGTELKDFWGGAVQKNCAVSIFDINDSEIIAVDLAKIYY